MKKNKYDLAEDAAWMLHETENCEGCFMKKECHRDQEKEKILCSDVAALTGAIEKKYGL